MIQIQATITGYGGRACSLFSAYDQDTRVLIIGAETEYRAVRRDGCIVLTNDPDIARDGLFEDHDLKPAIEAFYAFKSGFASDGKSPRMAFSERAVRANPEQIIEKDGLDAAGPRYRISDGATCGQMAALATFLYASKSTAIERAVKLSEAFIHLGRGFILTI